MQGKNWKIAECKVRAASRSADLLVRYINKMMYKYLEINIIIDVSYYCIKYRFICYLNKCVLGRSH